MSLIRKIITSELIFIAEIGINHNGDAETALRMVEAAAAAGAHAVKFQTMEPAEMYSVYTSALLEKGREEYADRRQIDFFSGFTLAENDYAAIKEKALSLGMVFFSAPFDVKSVELLERLGAELGVKMPQPDRSPIFEIRLNAQPRVQPEIIPISGIELEGVGEVVFELQAGLQPRPIGERPAQADLEALQKVSALVGARGGRRVVLHVGEDEAVKAVEVGFHDEGRGREGGREQDEGGGARFHEITPPPGGRQGTRAPRR